MEFLKSTWYQAALAAAIAVSALAALSPPSNPVESLLLQRCGRCHDLPSPRDYTPSHWVWVIRQMSYNARLTQSQADELLRWLQANAKSESEY